VVKIRLMIVIDLYFHHRTRQKELFFVIGPISRDNDSDPD